jgi:hypothetical protein
MKKFRDALTWLKKAGGIITAAAEFGEKVVHLIED